MAVAPTRPGLRERKKQRTRQTIVEAATELFAREGYAATTVIEIAEAAEVSPSTFFKYFPTKADVVFSVYAPLTESLRRRVLDRPREQSATEALLAWILEDLPELEATYVELLRALPRIVESDPELPVEERLRIALCEHPRTPFGTSVTHAPEANARDLHAGSTEIRVLHVPTTSGR